MKLKSIHLKNYRAHEDLKVEFHDQFNVITGVNGSGKTSLLMGIKEVLVFATLKYGASQQESLFNDYCVRLKKTRKDQNRYRFEPQYPSEVMAKIVLGDHKQYDLEIKKTDEGPPGYYESLQSKDVDCDVSPLIAFYRAYRHWLLEATDEVEAATGMPSRLGGYKNCLNAGVSAISLQQWVIEKCQERLQTSYETGKLFHEIKDDELASANDALHKVLENFKGLRYDFRQKTILVDQCDSPEPLAFDLLSDGERAVICLVADIARRTCLLNPQLGQDVVSKTPGIVLIDELDVHLHPAWQRTIINGLKAAFPEIQFIVTSHSPQILGEARPEEIILLSPEGAAHPQAGYGLTSSQVLEEIMRAPERNVVIEGKLSALFAFIERMKLDEARTLLSEIEKDSPEIPELTGARILIHRKEVIGR